MYGLINSSGPRPNTSQIYGHLFSKGACKHCLLAPNNLSNSNNNPGRLIADFWHLNRRSFDAGQEHPSIFHAATSYSMIDLQTRVQTFLSEFQFCCWYNGHDLDIACSSIRYAIHFSTPAFVWELAFFFFEFFLFEFKDQEWKRSETESHQKLNH